MKEELERLLKDQQTNSGKNETINSGDDTEEILGDEEVLVDENKSLLYKSRIRELIKDVASSDGLDLRISKEGFQRYHDSVKFLSVILMYEINSVIKEQKKKTLNVAHVDEAISKMLGRADALNISIQEIERVLEVLQSKSHTTSISRAMDYLIMENEGTESEDEGSLVK